MYQKEIQQFDSITSFPKSLREKLQQDFCIAYEEKIETMKISKRDKSRKYVLAFKAEEKKSTCHTKEDTALSLPVSSAQKHSLIECVFIPEKERGTICVSSQVGCSLSCKFCQTGTQALERNLKYYEIVNQVLRIKQDLKDFSKEDEANTVTNIVFMGQGEPLYNYKEVKQAIEVLADENGLAFPMRKIVLSTSGVVPGIKKISTELPQLPLAISLHATTDELRNELVPINKMFNLDTLFTCLRSLENIKTSRPLTFEYVMLKDVNDSVQDAKRLLELIKDLPCSVNLIAFNPWEGSGFECSPKNRIIEFSEFLYGKGMRAPIRWSKGKDISGACGQLRSTSKLKQEFIKRLAEQKGNSSSKVVRA